jgi:hypothetical protein
VEGDFFLQTQFFETLGGGTLSEQKTTGDYKDDGEAKRVRSPGHTSKIQLSVRQFPVGTNGSICLVERESGTPSPFLNGQGEARVTRCAMLAKALRE